MFNQEHKKHNYREEDGICPQHYTICGAIMNSRNDMSEKSLGNRVVVDMFSMANSCNSWIR